MDLDAPKKTDPGVKEGIELASQTIVALRGLLDQADQSVRSAKALLAQATLSGQAERLGPSQEGGLSVAGELTARMVEGVFDGHQMIGSDSRHYPVPPNYASKSKLVAGDVLKLTIAADGTFIFKQIGPIDRKKLIGELEEDQGRYFVSADGKRYQVLVASVTYYRAKSGDRLTIIVPRDTETEWAAVENLLSAA